MDEEEEESCNTELGLGLSIIQFVPKRKQHQQQDSNNNDGSNKNYSRKKLRLTKEQTNLLEDNFKLHSSLNSDEKHALAEQLNLQPRQVEVWFQNKRARTKLKKTEVECELLEKCCKSLSDENQILKKEVQRLRELKQLAISSAHFNIQLLPKAAVTLTMCAACENNNILQAGEGKAVAVLDVVRQANKLESGSDNTF